MGKMKKNVKGNNIEMKAAQLFHQRSITKSSPKITFKRMLMLRRRIISFQIEKTSWEKKNNDLLENLKAEKMLSANLRKESFHWQQLYHEAMITINSYKVKQEDMTQMLSASLREIDSIYPHLVAFSESVTSNKIRMCNMLNSLPSSEYSGLPRQFQETGKIEYEFNKKNEKPMKQRVGPMVRGLLITKPKIMLERLMLPQAQDQEPVNTDISAIEENNQLTPIAEENEHENDMHLRHVSLRPKRKKLGSSWRLRQQEKLEKDRERERERVSKSSSTVGYDDSSDTESNPTAIEHIEPVVRFKDVSRLFQNSSLLKVDSARSAEGSGSTDNRHPDSENRHLTVNTVKRTTDDPLEGSSWMFTNNHNHRAPFKPSLRNGSPSSLYQSDSSDEENIVVTKSNTSDLSALNTLVMNQTYNITKRIHDNSMPAEISGDCLNDSQSVEPDSTNNIDVHLLNNSSFCKSSGNEFRSSSSSSDSLSKSSVFHAVNSSNEQNIINNPHSEQRISINANLVSVCLSKVAHDTRLSASNGNSICDLMGNKRKSNPCDNCSPGNSFPEELGKRVRKPKIHLYPGEETVVMSSNAKICKPPRLSTGRKSLIPNKNFKLKKKLSGKRSSSTSGADELENTTSNEELAKTSATKKKVEAIQLKKSISADTNFKKSSIKKSIHTPRTSATDRILHSLGNEESVRPRRTKTNICYKESPLNMKQRRP